MAATNNNSLSSEHKAAMILNLRDEVSTRAEKLGLMYRTQMETLRSRLERRVNRIPNTLRDVNILDLIDKHSNEAKRPTTATSEQSTTRPVGRPRQKAPAQSTQTAKTKGNNKRSSNELSSDKENLAEELAVPKKRTKVAAGRTAAPQAARTAAEPPARTTRAASRKVAAPEVLSPKSNNARAAASGRARRQR